mgnify:CR=1 FL=1
MLAYMTANEAAEKWNISHRRVLTLCRENRIANVAMLGNMWIIPIDAQKPEDARSRRYIESEDKVVKPFLKWAGGKGQLLKEIEHYYPFAKGKISSFSSISSLLKVSLTTTTLCSKICGSKSTARGMMIILSRKIG